MSYLRPSELQDTSRSSLAAVPSVQQHTDEDEWLTICSEFPSLMKARTSIQTSTPRHYQTFHITASQPEPDLADLPIPTEPAFPHQLSRESEFLSHPVFNKHHSDTEMLRYIFHLASKDLGLVHAMMPLGSCTMKLSSTSSMIPLTWPEFGGIHPFAPHEQVEGYWKIIKELEDDLRKIAGFYACSVQPNSGAAGEYAGLTVIRAYHQSRGEGHLDMCLASAVMAGLKVVPVKTHSDGNLDVGDLKAKAEKHKDNLAVFMITYPSTFGVFEDGITDACKIIHDRGGQVYLDGANLNAQVGLTNPAVFGGDVCHHNLNKTFAIPHGGGGPGVGPICVAEHLAPFLPSHPLVKTSSDAAIDAVSASPFGSAFILLISWAYIKMLGGNGLSDLRFKNKNGRVAHELLIDLAEFDKAAGLKVTDFAKRVQDYGFHPPTCSWPISTCMLIEPTESETLEEIDRFCDAMIQIRKEVEDIITGKQPKDNNLLKNAPHPLSLMVTSDKEWNRPYSREEAAYPVPWLREKKFWPTVFRIDDAYSDLNLILTVPVFSVTAQQSRSLRPHFFLLLTVFLPLSPTSGATSSLRPSITVIFFRELGTSSRKYIFSIATRAEVLSELYDAFWGPYSHLFLPSSNPSLPNHATLSNAQADLGFAGAGSEDPIVPGRPSPLAILSIIHNTPSETALSMTVASYVAAAFTPMIIQIIMSASSSLNRPEAVAIAETSRHSPRAESTGRQ
ncbi:PLP-dependent transferase [Suillus brevipes Sb2]|nr:PLP-dependent transferase [Suillus brevipes Sb2]